MNREIVELSPAYLWDCPECGRENFQRAITYIPTAEDRENDPNIPEDDGHFMTRPETVVCRHPDCGKMFKCQDIREGDNE